MSAHGTEINGDNVRPRHIRVLHVTHQYPPAIGGSEKHIADLSEELAARGHQVDVFTSRSLDYHTWRSELRPRERVNGVDVYRFRSMRRTRLAWLLLHWSLHRYWQNGCRYYEPLILLGNGPLCPGLFAALLVRSSRYDLVHLNSLVYSHAAYGYLAAHWRNVPIVVTPHVEAAQRVTYGIGYQLDVLRSSDHVIADTAAERAFLIELGLESSKVTTAGVGVRPEQYPVRDRDACRRRLELPRDAFVPLFLGRQVEYKGIETALQAFVTLQQHFSHVHIVVAGPKTEYSRRLFARYRGWPGVTNLGSVSDAERLDALNACDCLLLPSTGEAFGLVFLEAWIVGKPVIGVRTAATSEIIRDGVDGWLVPPGDPWALAEVLIRWIESPDLARQMGQAGRRKVLSDYTCARIVDVVEGIYARTLSRAPQR